MTDARHHLRRTDPESPTAAEKPPLPKRDTSQLPWWLLWGRNFIIGTVLAVILWEIAHSYDEEEDMDTLACDVTALSATNSNNHNNDAHHRRSRRSACPDDYFSETYISARDKFRTAATKANAIQERHVVCDIEGIEYTIDTALITVHRDVAAQQQTAVGDDGTSTKANAENEARNSKNKKKHTLLVHISGVGGAEGFAGGALQTMWLEHHAAMNQLQHHDGGGGTTNNGKTKNVEVNTSVLTTFPWWRDGDVQPRFDGGLEVEEHVGNCAADASHTSAATTTVTTDILFIHAVNPYGMANNRRVNENNVELGRNFILSEEEWAHVLQRDPDTERYEEFDPAFNPQLDPKRHRRSTNKIDVMSTVVKGLWYVARFGFDAIQRAFRVGQYHNPRGVMYGGNGKLEPSMQILKSILETQKNKKMGEKEQQNYYSKVAIIDVYVGFARQGTHALTTHERMLSRVQGIFNHDQVVLNLMARQFTVDPKTNVTTRRGIIDYSKIFPSVDRDVVPQEQQVDDDTTGLAESGVGENANDDSDNGVLLFEVRQDFGSWPKLFLSHGLVLENAAYHCCRDTPTHRVAGRWLRDAMYPNADRQWKRMVLQRGGQAIQRSVDSLVKAAVVMCPSEGTPGPETKGTQKG